MRKAQVTCVCGTIGVAAISLVAAVNAPVSDATMVRNVEAVRSLLEEGADVNASQGDGMTALHWAAEHGDVKMVTMLLGAGADLEMGTRSVNTLRSMWLAPQAMRRLSAPCSRLELT